MVLSWLVPHTQNGETVLIRAAADGKVDCVRLLLEAGANAEATRSVRTNQNNASLD